MRCDKPMGEFHCDFPPFPGRKNDENMTHKLEKRIQNKNKTMRYVMVCTYYVPYVPFQRSHSGCGSHTICKKQLP